MPTCAFSHRACSPNCILGQTFQQSMCALCLSALTGAWLTSGRGSPETLGLEPASLMLHPFRHRRASVIRGLCLLRPWWTRTLIPGLRRSEPMASSNRNIEAMMVVTVFSFLWGRDIFWSFSWLGIGWKLDDRKLRGAPASTSSFGFGRAFCVVLWGSQAGWNFTKSRFPVRAGPAQQRCSLYSLE